jgi:hypothetical protein
MHPPIINDPVFGELRWDPTDYLRWYEGAVEFAPEHQVALLIYTEGGEPFKIIERARVAFQAIQRRASDYPTIAAKELLKVYNEEWNDGPSLAVGAFASRIALYRFSFYPDGKVELDYDDDDLFLGHTIKVCLDKSHNVTNVGLEG